MAEQCFDTCKSTVMNLTTPAATSSTHIAGVVTVDAVVDTPKYSNSNEVVTFSMSLPADNSSVQNAVVHKQILVNSVLEDEITSNAGVLETYDQNSTASITISEESANTTFKDAISNNIKSVSTENNSVYDVTKSLDTSISLNSSETLTRMETQGNGVIVMPSSTTIFLETPVVDEQQQHHLHLVQVNNNSNEYSENVSKPKRLSDEFLLVEREITTADKDAATRQPQKGGTFESDVDILETDLQHDKMSFRLKKMNINTTVHEHTLASCDDKPSSSSTTNSQSAAEIQSMDLIERRDFETEQHLTGGIIIKSSSLINKNKLNLNLLQSCTQQMQNDDAPSGSRRIISSDSKCTYKDLTSTPTSSRAYNSRLTKSTAKMNLSSTLSHEQQPQQQPLHHPPTSVIVEAPSSSSTSANVSMPAAPELYSNSNSNDSLTSDRCFTNESKSNNSSAEQAKQQPTAEYNNPVLEASTDDKTACSRTGALAAEGGVRNAEVLYDDAVPSTSSARCQYAPVLKNMRQVNASAQTNERYLERAAACSTADASVAVSGVNLSTNRSRRRYPTAQFNKNSTSDDVIAAFKVVVAEAAAAAAAKESGVGEYHDDAWADCEENSDIEEVCTCQHSISGSSSHGGSLTSLNETEDLEVLANAKEGGDLSNYIQMVSISEDGATIVSPADCATLLSNQHQRKRKYNESRHLDSEYGGTFIHSGCGSNGGGDAANSRKRIAYDYASTPRSSQSGNTLMLVSVGCATPSSSLSTGSPLSRRTPRSLIPTRENPPPELQDWLAQYQRWSHAERLLAVDRLIEHCEPTQVRHMMKVIEPQFQRDFISLLPRELALQVLAYLEPMDLLRAAQTCRSWRFLCDDNLLWKEKCRKSQILTEPRSDRPKRGRAGNMPHIASPWKAAYMRQHIIEMNWRSRPIRDPKILKGHDDHVITCLQFSGNRIVSGSDDNTLKVWSAVTGRCLRTLVGHTGGVWSSQMSGNIIISGSTDRTLKVWDMETGHCVHTLLGHTSTVRCMHLHGKRVVSGSRDATLRVWDIEQGTCLHVLVGHLAAVRCVQYDGKLIVSGAYDYMVKIWHPERQECLHTLQGHTNRVYSLQFDGLHVVSGSLDTSIRVWDVETGNCKHTLMGHQSLTSGMELRQNILVSGNADSTVKVWDITTGQCLQTLSGPNKHQSAVTCLQFNSRFVVTSSDDGTVKLWDVKTGEFIRNLVALDSGGSGGVVWRIRANDTKLICAVGSRNGTEETKLMVLDFDVEGACVKCS